MEQENTSLNAAKPRGSGDGFLLTDGDIEILRCIHEHRFLRREQVGHLVGRHAKRVHRRVSRLADRGYLSTIRLPQQKYIYAIGTLGVPVLAEHGLCESDLVNQRLRTRELKELFLRHEMMIVDLHVAISLAARDSDVAVTSWKEGKELFDSVVTVDGKGSSRLPVRPDAFFSLRDALRENEANTANFALEADRSTTAQTRFEDKIRAYWAYIEQGRHVQKYDVKGFRVLTVTLTEARARNLCRLAASVVPERGRKYFQFVPLERILSSDAPLRAPLCYSARIPNGETKFAVVPVPTQLQKEIAVV